MATMCLRTLTRMERLSGNRTKRPRLRLIGLRSQFPRRRSERRMWEVPFLLSMPRICKEVGWTTTMDLFRRDPSNSFRRLEIWSCTILEATSCSLKLIQIILGIRRSKFCASHCGSVRRKKSKDLPRRRSNLVRPMRPGLQTTNRNLRPRAQSTPRRSFLRMIMQNSRHAKTRMKACFQRVTQSSPSIAMRWTKVLRKKQRQRPRRRSLRPRRSGGTNSGWQLWKAMLAPVFQFYVVLRPRRLSFLTTAEL
mmetsp:Transcript_29314/g.63618  ORF Transcript_29314/g.63618 Transcript_29314/m.63618 type:complete len:251 (-) Transcript_29314:3191-3943(-)